MKKKLFGHLLLILAFLSSYQTVFAQNTEDKTGALRGTLILDNMGSMNNYGQAGFEKSDTYEIAVKYTPDELMAFYGQKLTYIMFVVKGDASGPTWSSINAKVYKGSRNHGTAPAELIYNKPVANVENGYLTSVKVSDDNLTLEYGYDYWLTYEIAATGGTPFGCDRGPSQRGKNQWIKSNGIWQEFVEFGSDCNVGWVIRAYVGGTSYPDTHAPVICSINGLDTFGQTDMKLQISVKDKSALPTVLNAVYNVGGVEKTISMQQSSVLNIYNGNIPKQDYGITGTVKFNLKDNLNNSAWSEDYPISWLNHPILEENFDNLTVPALPVSWKAIDSNGDQTKWQTGVKPELASTAPNMVYMNYSPSQMTTDDWLISPSINVKAGQKYNIRFKYRATKSGDREYMTAYIGDDQSVSSMQIKPAIWKDISFDHTNWKTAELIFTPTTDGVCYIGLHAFSSYLGGNTIFVDDFSVHGEAPSDVTPPVLINISGTKAPVGQPISINLILNDITGIGSILGYYKLNGQSSFIPFNLQPVNAKGNFVYSGYINSPQGAATGMVKFVAKDSSPAQNTLTSQEYPIEWVVEYAEGFEGAQFPPLYWYLQDINSDNLNWKQSYAPQFNIHSGMKVAYSESDDKLPDNGLITPAYDVKTGGQMKFWRAAQNNLAFIEHYTVSVAVNPNANGTLWKPSYGDFTKVFEEEISSQGWLEKVIALDSYVGKQIRLMFRHNNSVRQVYLNLDDVKFINCTPKPDPSSINDPNSKVIQPTLYTNYPNPFNPETSITYSIPQDGLVKMSVYDCRGALVSLLENSKKQAGSHTTMFKANGLPSGVYFYTLEYNGIKVGINKMMMIK